MKVKSQSLNPGGNNACEERGIARQQVRLLENLERVSSAYKKHRLLELELELLRKKNVREWGRIKQHRLEIQRLDLASPRPNPLTTTAMATIGAANGTITPSLARRPRQSQRPTSPCPMMSGVNGTKMMTTADGAILEGRQRGTARWPPKTCRQAMSQVPECPAIQVSQPRKPFFFLSLSLSLIYSFPYFLSHSRAPPNEYPNRQLPSRPSLQVAGQGPW